jgi:hypothetical protein
MVAVETSTVGDYEMSQVVNGHMVLSGYLHRASWNEPKDRILVSSSGPVYLATPDDPKSELPVEIWCLPIYRGRKVPHMKQPEQTILWLHGLIVCHADASDGSIFRRVSYFKTINMEIWLKKDTEAVKIKVI